LKSFNLSGNPFSDATNVYAWIGTHLPSVIHINNKPISEEYSRKKKATEPTITFTPLADSKQQQQQHRQPPSATNEDKNLPSEKRENKERKESQPKVIDVPEKSRAIAPINNAYGVTDSRPSPIDQQNAKLSKRALDAPKSAKPLINSMTTTSLEEKKKKQQIREREKFHEKQQLEMITKKRELTVDEIAKLEEVSLSFLCAFFLRVWSLVMGLDF
jgi:hypothetical protein